jgi:hypothetical protein
LKKWLCELCRIDVEAWEIETVLGTPLSLEVLEERVLAFEDAEDEDD